ncbi:MAG: C_GCAxxG_C_C family protein, partial [Firmicutes bacterium]|nr:C_GCAxxG_C_C family protein [Bacillota bacterium]
AKECSITEEEAFKLGSCFGSGMRKGQVCGAVTGALMVLGLLYRYPSCPRSYRWRSLRHLFLR